MFLRKFLTTAALVLAATSVTITSADAAPAGNTYETCASNGLPANTVVDRIYTDLRLCGNPPAAGGYQVDNVQDRFVLPTGKDAVGKRYTVCISTLPADWYVLGWTNTTKCGQPSPTANAVNIIYNGP